MVRREFPTAGWNCSLNDVSPLNQSTTKWQPSHLCLSLDGVHLVDKLTVRLEEQQQLKVQLIESAAQFQLLGRHRHSCEAAFRSAR